MRQRVNIDGLDEDIMRYDRNGLYVPRREPLDIASEEWAVLANLNSLTNLINKDIVGDEDDEDEGSDIDDVGDAREAQPRIDVYPQAGLRRYGHFKANRPPKGFDPIIRQLDHDFAENRDERRPLVRGRSCQGYNYAQHSLTDRAGGLEVVRGQVTASMAGMGTSTGPRIRRINNNLRKTLDKGLPYPTMARKVAKPNIGRAFRIE